MVTMVISGFKFAYLPVRLRSFLFFWTLAPDPGSAFGIYMNKYSPGLFVTGVIFKVSETFSIWIS